MDELGWHWLYDTVHHAEEAVAALLPAVSGLLGWLTNTLASALLGLVVGGLVVAVLHIVPRRRTRAAH
jgi:predicted DNA repair protein MutK